MLGAVAMSISPETISVWLPDRVISSCTVRHLPRFAGSIRTIWFISHQDARRLSAPCHKARRIGNSLSGMHPGIAAELARWAAAEPRMRCTMAAGLTHTNDQTAPRAAREALSEAMAGLPETTRADVTLL